MLEDRDFSVTYIPLEANIRGHFKRKLGNSRFASEFCNYNKLQKEFVTIGRMSISVSLTLYREVA